LNIKCKSQKLHSCCWKNVYWS